MATPERFIKQSLEKLQVDYIDLFLIHTPKSWKVLQGDYPKPIDLIELLV
jgi:diketogulonate reductase-like aldo/keto reductase